MQKAQAVDTKLLDEWIDQSGLKTSFLVDQLGISRQAFDKKRKGITKFRKSEVYVMCDLLRIPGEISAKIFCQTG